LWVTVMCLCALGTSAAGGKDTPDLKFRILDETAPAGSIVQMKVRTTEVTPISGGRGSFAFDGAFFKSISGIGLFATNGESAGAAVVDGNRAAWSFVTTEPFTGEYPVLAVALQLRSDLPIASRSSFTLDAASLWNLNGTMVRARYSAGTVTVGGSVAIGDVVPGEGWVPAGTVISVRGVGFNAQSRLRIGDLSIGSVRVISATEMQATLREPANMTGQMLRVDNPDQSRSTYYAYLRGRAAAISTRPLLARTYAIFSGTSRSVATFGPLAAATGPRYTALALQNPNLAAADVMVGLYAPNGALFYSATRSLESGTRLTLELSELLGGIVPPPGTLVRVISSLPIEAFSLLCDDGALTVAPSLPVEAAR
jgi:hypothetical protein